MRRVSAAERHSKARRAVRTGRPPRKRAGEVEARILDAARRLFLERGLAGASVDEIASLARAGLHLADSLHLTTGLHISIDVRIDSPRVRCGPRGLSSRLD
jgi:hypothetical protein